MIKKIILLSSLIGALLIIHYVAKLFWHHDSNAGVVLNCNLQLSCQLPNKDIIHVAQKIQLHSPFTVQLKTNTPHNNITITFTMQDMDMGFNQYNLNYLKGNIWVAKDVFLPICSHKQKNYILNLIIDNKTQYQIPFTVEATNKKTNHTH